MAELYKIKESILTCYNKKVTSKLNIIFDENKKESTMFSLYPEEKTSYPYKTNQNNDEHFFTFGYNNHQGLSLLTNIKNESNGKQKKCVKNDILTDFTALKKEEPLKAVNFFDKYGFLFNIEKYTQVTYDEILVWQKHLVYLVQLFNEIKEYNLVKKKVSPKNEQNQGIFEFDYSKILEAVLYFATKKAIEIKYNDKIIKRSNELLFNKLLDKYQQIFKYKFDYIYSFDLFSDDYFEPNNIKKAKNIRVYSDDDAEFFGCFSDSHKNFVNFFDDYLNMSITYEQFHCKNNQNIKKKEGFLSELSVYLIYETCSEYFAEDDLTRKLVVFMYHFMEEITGISILNDGNIEFYEVDDEVYDEEKYKKTKSINRDFNKFHKLLIEIANLIIESEINYHLKNLSYNYDSYENKIKCKAEDLYTALVVSILLNKDLTVYKQCPHCGGLFRIELTDTNTKYCSANCQTQHNNARSNAREKILNKDQTNTGD